MLEDKQLEQFKEDYLNNITFKEIKKKYSIKSNGVLYRIIDKLGLEARNGSYPSKEELEQYYIVENHSLKDTKKYFNISTRTFYRLSEEYNIVKSEEAKVERTRQTMIERYNFDNARKVPEISNKIAQTNLEKYGSISPFGNKEIRDKIEQHFQEKWKGYPLSTKEIQDKVRASAINNDSYTHSKPEDKLYQELIELFGKDKVERQYRSELYPFYCDFYIKGFDIYIEGQFSHFHHRKPFNPLSNEDQQELQFLIEKAKEKTYYNRIIETWTEKDPLKRKVAKENNLNYLEFFTLKEFYKWKEKYRNLYNIEREN